MILVHIDFLDKKYLDHFLKSDHGYIYTMYEAQRLNDTILMVNEKFLNLFYVDPKTKHDNMKYLFCYQNLKEIEYFVPKITLFDRYKNYLGVFSK